MEFPSAVIKEEIDDSQVLESTHIKEEIEETSLSYEINPVFPKMSENVSIVLDYYHRVLHIQRQAIVTPPMSLRKDMAFFNADESDMKSDSSSLKNYIFF